jgi:hypothetical protein
MPWESGRYKINKKSAIEHSQPQSEPFEMGSQPISYRTCGTRWIFFEGLNQISNLFMCADGFPNIFKA